MPVQAKNAVCPPMSKELLSFIRKHYVVETNQSESKTLEQILNDSQVIFLGETHHESLHQKWNGKIIHALWADDTALLVEHKPVGSQEQLSGVAPEIASKAKQWDRTKSGTAALFDKLVKLSKLIPDDFRKLAFPENDVQKATKDLIKRATQLIDSFLIQPFLVEEAWNVIDQQIANILDEAESSAPSKDRINLMFKQAYLRVWVIAAKQTLDRFLIELEGEMVERNGSMTQAVADSLKNDKRVLLIAGSDHFNHLLTDAKLKRVKNPVFTYLQSKGFPYAVLIPVNDKKLTAAREMTQRILHIGDADTDEIEQHALNLVAQLEEMREDEGDSKNFQKFIVEIAQLKELCMEAVKNATIQGHEKAQQFHYSTGAICLRIHDLTKTIQLWNVTVELALADQKNVKLRYL